MSKEIVENQQPQMKNSLKVAFRYAVDSLDQDMLFELFEYAQKDGGMTLTEVLAIYVEAMEERVG